MIFLSVGRAKRNPPYNFSRFDLCITMSAGAWEPEKEHQKSDFGKQIGFLEFVFGRIIFLEFPKTK
jgi:hypothetical protein